MHKMPIISRAEAMDREWRRPWDFEEHVDRERLRRATTKHELEEGEMEVTDEFDWGVARGGVRQDA